MIFIDASAYLAIVMPFDNNRGKALRLSKTVFTKENNLITSNAILGEVLTICSQRHNREAAIDFVSDILKGKTNIVLENKELTDKSFDIFKTIKDKDVSWVDCYSFAIIEHYKIEKVFSFDKDFKKYAKAKLLE